MNRLIYSVAAVIIVALNSCSNNTEERTKTSSGAPANDSAMAITQKGVEDTAQHGHKHLNTVTAGGSADYNITAPKGWTKTADTIVRGGGRFIQLTSAEEPGKDGFKESVNVITEKLLKPGLDNYVSSGKFNMMKHIPGIEILKEGSSTVSGQPAHWIKYGFMFGPMPHTNIVYLLLKDDVGYVITCNARTTNFDKYEPAFNQAVNSFTLGKGSTK